VGLICEECGKSYEISQEQIELYKKKPFMIRCAECGQLINMLQLLEKKKKPEKEE